MTDFDVTKYRQFIVDNAHSRYKYVPGFKIAGALTGKE